MYTIIVIILEIFILVKDTLHIKQSISVLSTGCPTKTDIYYLNQFVGLVVSCREAFEKNEDELFTCKDEAGSTGTVESPPSSVGYTTALCVRRLRSGLVSSSST